MAIMAHDLDVARVDAALAMDPAWVAAVHAQWREMIDLAVWGDIAMAQLGAAPRARKRLLELGERLKSLTTSRGWIPHPRERLKSALAAALGVREALDAVNVLLAGLSAGADAQRLRAAHQALDELIKRELPVRENTWAQLLDGQISD